MKLVFLFSAILMPCAMANADEPILEWRVRLLEKTIPEGTEETFKSDDDYIKDRKAFTEKASIAIYTAGFQAGMAKSSSGIGTFSLAIYPIKDDGDDCMIVNCVFRKDPAVTGRRITQSKLLQSNGNEFVLISSKAATHDRKKPGRLVNIKNSLLILTVKTVKGNIPQLATDSAKESAPTRNERHAPKR